MASSGGESIRYWPYGGTRTRFVQADTIVPQPGNPQALNRYAYALNNPVRYRDPSGHWFETAWDIANILWDIYEVRRDPSLVNIGALVLDVGAVVLPLVLAGAGLPARGSKAAKAAEVFRFYDETIKHSSRLRLYAEKFGFKLADDVHDWTKFADTELAKAIGHEGRTKSIFPKRPHKRYAPTYVIVKSPVACPKLTP